MVQGMTGFGSAERSVFKVEIRSVNHRFMDIAVRIPQNLNQHEIPLRNILKSRFSRGKFDVTVSMTGDERTRIKIDMAMAKELYESLQSLKNELSLPGTLSIETISGFRELVLLKDVEYSTAPLYDAFSEAVDRLYEMRSREGEATVKDMLLRLGHLEQMKDQVIEFCPDVVDAFRNKFLERLCFLFGEARYDEGRILQEAAIMAERMDISEEVARIGLHIAQARKILSDGDTIGRKIEFLLQELMREVNTMASKSDDYRVSSIAIEMKSEIEKIREQAQNIQ